MSDKKNRKVWSRILAILFAIVLPLSTIAAWAVTTVTNTDRWVATLHPLATNPTITNYLAQEGAQELVTQLDLENRIKAVLPAGASFIAGTITTQVESTINKILANALARPQFAKFWDTVNRQSHQIAMAVIDGQANGEINQARDVVLNFAPQVLTAIDQLIKKGYTFLVPIRADIVKNRILILHLLSQKELNQIHSYYKLATTLRWVLPLFSLLLAVGIVLTARPRRSGFRRLGIFMTASAAVTFALLRIGIAVAAPLAPTPTDVSTAILHAVTAYLSRTLIWLVLIGVGILVITWFTGPGARAVATRHWIAVNARAIKEAVTRRSHSLADADLDGWTKSHRSQLSIGLAVTNVVVIIAGISLVIWWVPSFWWLLVVLALGAGWFFLYQRLHTYIDAPNNELESGDTVTALPEQQEAELSAKSSSDGDSAATE